MSAVAATAALRWTRGSTVEEVFTYLDPDQLPVNLTDYEARMQVRTLEGQYGLSGAETLLLELSTEGANPALDIDLPETGVIALRVAAEDTLALNPQNLRKVMLCYSMELYQPGTPEYVVPLVQGKITVYGETTR